MLPPFTLSNSEKARLARIQEETIRLGRERLHDIFVNDIGLDGIRDDIREAYESANADNKILIEQALVFIKYRLYGRNLRERTAPTQDANAWLVLGAKPWDLAPELTRKEASAWAVQSEHSEPKDWLWNKLTEKHPELKVASTPEDIAIMRWVERVMSSPARREAFIREREAIFGDPMQVDGSILRRLDEIRVPDLCVSPLDTIVRAIERQVKERWDGPNELIPNQKWEKNLPEGVRLLKTFTDLLAEGSVMRHCVASYASAVVSGRSIILSIKVGEERSTVEVANGKIVQHRGMSNIDPPASCVDVASAMMSAVKNMTITK